MKTLQLVLKDKTAIALADAALSMHIVVVCKDGRAFQEIWNKLTDDNLSDVLITEGGTAIQRIVGMTLSGTQTVRNADG